MAPKINLLQRKMMLSDQSDFYDNDNKDGEFDDNDFGNKEDNDTTIDK